MGPQEACKETINNFRHILKMARLYNQLAFQFKEPIINIWIRVAPKFGCPYMEEKKKYILIEAANLK